MQISETNQALEHHAGDFGRLRTAMASQRVRAHCISHSTLTSFLKETCDKRAIT